MYFVTHLTSAELDSICFENREHLSQADYIGLLNLLDFVSVMTVICTDNSSFSNYADSSSGQHLDQIGRHGS